MYLFGCNVDCFSNLPLFVFYFLSIMDEAAPEPQAFTFLLFLLETNVLEPTWDPLKALLI